MGNVGEALQLLVEWADAGVGEANYDPKDCAEIRNAINLIARATGIDPSKIECEMIDAYARRYRENG